MDEPYRAPRIYAMDSALWTTTLWARPKNDPSGQWYVREDIHEEALEELKRLREWKESAMVELGKWDAVYEALGSPGKLGESKAEAALEEIGK